MAQITENICIECLISIENVRKIIVAKIRWPSLIYSGIVVAFFMAETMAKNGVNGSTAQGRVLFLFNLL
jgi:hypothetical protein